MRNIGQSGKLFWGIGFGFGAGVVFVAILPWFRGSSVPSQPNPLPHTANDGRAYVPAKPEPSIFNNPVGATKERVSGLTLADQTFESFRVITERNIFSRHRIAISGRKGSSSSALGKTVALTQLRTQPKQPLPFRLLGTVASDERDSYAILEVTETGAQDIYCVGQMIGDVKIDLIEKNRVVVIRNGSRETLELVLTGQAPVPVPAIAVTLPSTPQPGSQDLVRIAADGARQINTAVSPSQVGRATDSFLQRLRLSPAIVDGESIGLRVSGLEDSTMARLIGLKDGDVIQSVNRHRVTNRRKAVQVLSKARRLGCAELSFMRDQESKSLVLQTSAW